MAFFAIEWPDPESENWRAGYKHWGDNGDTYFFRGIIGTSSMLNAALEASYKKTEPLIAELQRIVDGWQPAKFEDLQVSNCVVSYGLNWDGELTESRKKVTDFPHKSRFVSGRQLVFESGKKLFGYRPETFARCCQIEKK